MEAGNAANKWETLGVFNTKNVRVVVGAQRRHDGSYRYSVELGAPRREADDKTHRSVRLNGDRLMDYAKEFSEVLSQAVGRIDGHHAENPSTARPAPKREEKRPTFDKPGQGLARFRSPDAERAPKAKKDKTDKRVRDQQMRAAMKGKGR